MPKRILKNMLKEQDFVYGTMLQILDPDLTELIVSAGLDFLILDLEHTGKSIDAAYPCIMAAYAHDVPVIIRTADKYQYMIEQALDAGAQGVCVPTVETVEDCLDIVKAAKYAPMGTRGFCPMFATSRWMNHVSPDSKTFSEDANRDTFVMALIESPDGIKNLPEMVKVDGIDAFYMGPADYGMRVGKSIWDPEITAIFDEAAEIVRNAGKLYVSINPVERYVEQFKKGDKFVLTTVGVSSLKTSFLNVKKQLLDIAAECKE